MFATSADQNLIAHFLVERLNEMLKYDREAISRAIMHQFECKDGLSEEVVMEIGRPGIFTVLGLINGFIGHSCWRVAACYDNDTPNEIVEFRVISV